MNEEENEAIKHFKDEYETSKHYDSDLIIELDDAKILLNLIQKQDTEINKLNNVIDRMAKIINKITTEKYKIKNICEKGKCRYEECHEDNWENCIKEYFMKEDK